jgi:hypothetical protein
MRAVSEGACNTRATARTRSLTAFPLHILDLKEPVGLKTVFRLSNDDATVTRFTLATNDGSRRAADDD